MDKKYVAGITILLICVAIMLTACGTGSDGSAETAISDDIEQAAGTEETASVQPPAEGGTPFERYGVLKVKDGQLCDETGNPVQLRGMSSFGLQWADGYWVLTDEAFDVLAEDWQCDIIRLAMYVTSGGYQDNPGQILERVERGIELATQRGMYVMIDWHVLTPGDPNDEQYLTAGLSDRNMPTEFTALKEANPGWTGPQVFFGYLAQKYAHQGNVLYEPANEPNGLGSHGNRSDTWSRQLKPYYESIISVIRDYDKTGIIVCGTDNWSQFADAPVNDPIDDQNIMYTMHFYAGTHDAGYDPDPNNPEFRGNYWLREMTDNALAGGMAVFCTEWGTSEASGDGGPFIDFSLRWTDYMKDRGISWCAWSMAQKDEVSAAFNCTTSPTPDGTWQDEEVSISGRFYRAMIRNDPVQLYTRDMELTSEMGYGVHNGDVRHLPRDNPGKFVSLPFEFESGTREGWATDGLSSISNADLGIAIAETNALMFNFEFLPGKPEWEDGARLGSPHWDPEALTLEMCRDITAYTMDLFLEDGKATAGSIQLRVVLVPDGGSYWYEAGEIIDIDPVSGGEVITSPAGTALRKYEITVPFTIEEYRTEMRVRNIILAMFNLGGELETDYAGRIYYDNIGFIFD